MSIDTFVLDSNSILQANELVAGNNVPYMFKTKEERNFEA